MPMIYHTQQKSLPAMPRTAERDAGVALLFSFFDGVTTKALAQGCQYFGRIRMGPA
jgi:hypothetical protein